MNELEERGIKWSFEMRELLLLILVPGFWLLRDLFVLANISLKIIKHLQLNCSHFDYKYLNKIETNRLLFRNRCLLGKKHVASKWNRKFCIKYSSFGKFHAIKIDGKSIKKLISFQPFVYWGKNWENFYHFLTNNFKLLLFIITNWMKRKVI